MSEKKSLLAVLQPTRPWEKTRGYSCRQEEFHYGSLLRPRTLLILRYAQYARNAQIAEWGYNEGTRSLRGVTRRGGTTKIERKSLKQ
jgi:hypothetical protein